MSELLDIFLEKLPTAPDDAMSVRELTKSTGRGRSYVQARLNELHEQARLGVGWKEVPKIDGTRAIVPAYWLIDSN